MGKNFFEKNEKVGREKVKGGGKYNALWVKKKAIWILAFGMLPSTG